jgi:hypothetical protein
MLVIYSLKQTYFAFTPACSGALLKAEEERAGGGSNPERGRVPRCAALTGASPPPP